MSHNSKTLGAKSGQGRYLYNSLMSIKALRANI